MKIAAFDIAVKTLSVCIITLPEYNESNKLIYKEPIYWEVFNILDEYPICNEFGCDIAAKWKNEYNINYCGRHKKRGKVIKELEPLIVRDKVKDYNPFEIQLRFVQTLDQHPNIYDVDYMFIENQDQENSYMCSIASSLFTYYMKKAYVDQGETRRLKKIKYIRATKKTKNVPIIGEPYISTKGSAYLKRKDTSIVYCRRNCKEYHPKLLDFFESHRKKDDLADSYQTALAGLWELHFEQVYSKLTPENIEKYVKLHGISEINPKGRKKTFKQYVKEFSEKYIWITL